MEVGDVGYIREGKFRRLFNALLPEDHPSHGNFGVPDYHEQLTLNRDIEDHIDIGNHNPQNFCSIAVTLGGGPESDRWANGPQIEGEVSFSCPMNQGAVLCLPIKAKREDTVARTKFGKWIIKHIDRWFAWARQLELGVDRMEDIILVTGTHRTRSCANVAFPGGQRDAQVSFRAKIDHPGEIVAVNWQFSHERNRGAFLNCGPDGEDLPENQCIFVRGFRVTRKYRIFPRLKGAAGPNPDSEGYDEEPDPDIMMELIPVPAVPEYQDPLHILIQFIAEKAVNYDMILVHDDDLAQLHGIYDGTPIESVQPDAMLGLLQGARPKIHEVPLDLDLSAVDNGRSAGAETVRIATLSDLFVEPSPSSTHLAALKNHSEIATLLLEHGGDVDGKNIQELTPLYRGVYEGKVGLTHLLLQYGADVEARDNNGETALHLAARKNHSEIATLLFEHGANANAENIQDLTPLYCAAYEGQLEVMRVLLRHGADVGAQDKNGMTTLHLAARKNHSEMATLLLEHGANANAKNIQELSPLYYATKEGNMGVMRVLLQRGANVEARDQNGETALHIAVRNDNLVVVSLLLEQGADVNAQDNWGQSALTSASRLGHKDIIKLLSSRPRRIKTPPPPEDEPRYLTVVNPYPLNANLELHADRRTLALWLACCTGKDALLAMFHKPASPGMVVIEVDRDFNGFDGLLGLHSWSKFLLEPNEEQMDKSSKIFYCTYNTGRQVEKSGWKRVNIEEHWFNGWTANKAIIKHPYPKTSYCDVPSEAKTGAPMCRPLSQRSFPVPPPQPAPIVGSAPWLAARNANESASPAPSSAGKGRKAVLSDTASVASTSSRSTKSKSFSPPPAAPARLALPALPSQPAAPAAPSSVTDIFENAYVPPATSIRIGGGGTRPPGIDDPDYDPWNPLADGAPPAKGQPEASDAEPAWKDYDASRQESPTRRQKRGKWECSEHGPLCNPGICQEHARVERKKRLTEEQEKRKKEKMEREAKRAKALEKKERKKAEAMAEGARSGSSGGGGGGSDSDTSRDDGPSAPPQSDPEDWSIQSKFERVETPSTVSSARPASESGSDDDDDDGGASVARSRMANTSSVASRRNRGAPPPARVSSNQRGRRGKAPILPTASRGNAGPTHVSPASPKPATRHPASDARSAASQNPSTTGGRSSVRPSVSGNPRSSSVSVASAAGSDTGPRSGSRKSAGDKRSSASSGVRTGAGPSFIPSMSPAANSLPTFADTELGDDIAVVQAKAAREDRRINSGDEDEAVGR